MSAPKAAAPVVGFNHNVQYGPRMYHVQTEDSGLPHSHYITHIFVGGNIVASMKSSYADLVDAEPDLAKAVRVLMEAQHPLVFLVEVRNVGLGSNQTRLIHFDGDFDFGTGGDVAFDLRGAEDGNNARNQRHLYAVISGHMIAEKVVICIIEE